LNGSASTRPFLQFADTLEHGAAWAVDFSPGATFIAAGYGRGLAELRDLKTKRRIALLAGPERHFDGVMGFAFSRDGRTVFTASADATIKRWDVQSGRMEASFGGQLEAYLSVSLSPDGRRLATNGADGQVKIWEALTGQELAVFKFSIAHYPVFCPD